MKKLISLILALVMVMGLATTAFADEVKSPQTLTDETKSVDIPVKGEYIQQLKSDEIISVDVEWKAMNFTYAATQQGTWDPSSHSYKDPVTSGAWVNDTTSDIKVTNHSNVNVTANFSFKADITTVTGSFAEATASAALLGDDDYEDGNDLNPETNKSLSVDLNAGVLNGYKTADNKTVTFTIGGSLANTYTANTKLGTITVSVDKKATTSDDSEDNTGDGEKTVTALVDKKKYERMKNSEEERDSHFWYFYYNDHDPDWSVVDLVLTYSDGSTEEINAANSAVTITCTSGSTLEEQKANQTTGYSKYTLTYKEYSVVITVNVSDENPYSIMGNLDYRI